MRHDYRPTSCVGQIPRRDRIELHPGFRLLTEKDPAKKKFLLRLNRLAEVQLVIAVEILGIESPEKM